MQDSTLINLLNDLESDRTERKASINDIVGVNDNGSCSNLPITDRLLLTLAELHSNGNILPFPMMTVQKKHLNAIHTSLKS